MARFLKCEHLHKYNPKKWSVLLQNGFKPILSIF